MPVAVLASSPPSNLVLDLRGEGQSKNDVYSLLDERPNRNAPGAQYLFVFYTLILLPRFPEAPAMATFA